MRPRFATCMLCSVMLCNCTKWTLPITAKEEVSWCAVLLSWQPNLCFGYFSWIYDVVFVTFVHIVFILLFLFCWNYICRWRGLTVSIDAKFLSPEFLNIYWGWKVDFSRKAVFSKVRVYSRAHSGYNFFYCVFKTFLC